MTGIWSSLRRVDIQGGATVGLWPELTVKEFLNSLKLTAQKLPESGRSLWLAKKQTLSGRFGADILRYDC